MLGGVKSRPAHRMERCVRGSFAHLDTPLRVIHFHSVVH